METLHSKSLFALGLSSVLLTIAIYLAVLFVNGYALLLFMTLALFCAGLLFVFSFSAHIRLTYINSLLVLHLLTMIYGWIELLYVVHISKTLLSVITWAIILFTSFLLYQSNIQRSEGPSLKRIHSLFITAGLLYGAVTLFLLAAFFIFAGPAFVMVFYLIPLFSWALTYKFQLFLWRKKQRTAYGLLPIPAVFIYIVWAVMV